MKNYKSLQQGGGPPNPGDPKKIAQEIQDKVQNQMYDIEDAVLEMLQAGEDANSVGMALMQLGYKEEDVMQLFESLSQQQQQSQQQGQQQVPGQEVQQQGNAEAEQMMQEQMMQEQMMQESAGQQQMARRGGSFKDWYRQLGGNTPNTYHGLYKAQAGTNTTFPYSIDPNFTFGETTDYKPGPEDEYSANEVKGYLDFAKDLSGSNLVNKGSMGIQPSTGYEGPASQKVTAEMLKEQTPATDAVNAINWANKNLFSEDDPNRIYDMTIADNVYEPKVSPIKLGHKDVHRGKQVGSGENIPRIGYGQLGNEILNKMDDLTLMQYGGGNMPQIQQDNTKTITPSVQDIDVLTNYASKNPYTLQEQLNRVVNDKLKEMSNYDLSNMTEEDLSRLQNMMMENVKKDFYMKKMGGANSMYDFFMNNELPLYQAAGPAGGLASVPRDARGMYILNGINDLTLMRQAAAANRALSGLGPTAPRVNPTIYTQESTSSPAMRMSKPKNYDDETMQRWYETNKPKIKSNVLSPMQDSVYTGYIGPQGGDRRYGGNPFAKKKRVLRKQQGGQIVDIPTKVLKKLMANGAKFDML